MPSPLSSPSLRLVASGERGTRYGSNSKNSETGRLAPDSQFRHRRPKLPRHRTSLGRPCRRSCDNRDQSGFNVSDSRPLAFGCHPLRRRPGLRRMTSALACSETELTRHFSVQKLYIRALFRRAFLLLNRPPNDEVQVSLQGIARPIGPL